MLRTLCLAGMKRYCWRRVSTVRYLASTSTFTGLSRHARCSLATLLVMVAEKSCVLRSLGITCCNHRQHYKQFWCLKCHSQQPCCITATLPVLVAEESCDLRSFGITCTTAHGTVETAKNSWASAVASQGAL